MTILRRASFGCQIVAMIKSAGESLRDTLGLRTENHYMVRSLLFAFPFSFFLFPFSRS